MDLLLPTDPVPVQVLIFLFCLVLDSGTIVRQAAAENIEELFANLVENDIEYDFVTLEEGLHETATATAIAEYLAAEEFKKVFLEFVDPLSTTVGDTTSPLYEMANTENKAVVMMYDKTGTRDYKSVGYASEWAGVDYFGIDTHPDGKWIYLNAFKPTALDETEAAELRKRNCNFFTRYGRFRIVAEGVTAKPGEWVDSSIWADWFGNDAYNAFFTLFINRNKVPATARGVSLLEAALLPTLQAGVRNGGATPGIFPEDSIAEIRQATGNDSYDGVTTTGWYIYIQPLATRSRTQIAQRRSPTVYIWMNGSGAFHFAAVRAILREGGSQLLVTSTADEASAADEAAA